MNDLLDLGRDQQSFVQTRKQAGLNWEDSLTKGEAYSSYMLKGKIFKDNLHILQTAYKLASSIISTITPHKVFIGLDPKENYATACKKIVLSTQVMDEKSLSPFEKIDIFLGTAVHEASHTEETDFDLLSFPNTPKGEIMHEICNILEDERIEKKTTDKHPGYGVFLGKTKYYYFDKLYLANIPEYSKQTAGQKLYNLFFAMVRYPKYIRKEDLLNFKIQVAVDKSIGTSNLL